MWELSGTRKEMEADILRHRGERAVRLMAKPSRQLFLRLLDQTQVREVHATPGLMRTVPARVRAALEAAGVKLVALEKRAGRPARHDPALRALALEYLKAGQTAGAVSSALKVPATSVYYWKRCAQGKKQTHRGEGEARKAAALSEPDST